jgi:hypothetical protein
MNLEKHNNTEIPSLAINWVNPEDLMHITHMQQVFKPHAAPYTAADPKLHCDSTLILNGIYVDRITGVGDLMATKMNENIHANYQTFCRWMLFAIITTTRDSIDRPYPTGNG